MLTCLPFYCPVSPLFVRSARPRRAAFPVSCADPARGHREAILIYDGIEKALLLVDERGLGCGRVALGAGARGARGHRQGHAASDLALGECVCASVWCLTSDVASNACKALSPQQRFPPGT